MKRLPGVHVVLIPVCFAAWSPARRRSCTTITGYPSQHQIFAVHD
jgi:hypothetical protein